MSDLPVSNLKIPLPRFLNELTSNGVPVPKAMAVAGKMSVGSLHPSRVSSPDVVLRSVFLGSKDTRNTTLHPRSASLPT